MLLCGIGGGWPCSLTMWVSGSSFLLLQAANASSCCLPKKLQSEWVNVTRDVLFAVKQAKAMHDAGEERVL